MANGEQKTGGDFYAVLGLSKECSDADLRNAYKKLAMRWHPDRCSATGNSKFVEEAKEKFQAIQEAYSVLSDTNKRFLYDVGAYDSDDDENGMGDFLGEMAQMMMSQTEPNENGHESFEELQRLFVEMFQSDLDGGGFGWAGTSDKTDGYDRSSAASSSSSQPLCNGNNKRDNSAMGSVKAGMGDSGSGGAVCSGSSGDSGQSSSGRGGGGGGGRGSGSSKWRSGRKQKVSSKHDVSSRDAEISAS